MEAKAKAGKVIYTARTHTTGGRDHGVSRSSDGHLDVKLANPGVFRHGIRTPFSG
jgi:lipoyl-dependent peroxiredoxin